MYFEGGDYVIYDSLHSKYLRYFHWINDIEDEFNTVSCLFGDICINEIHKIYKLWNTCADISNFYQLYVNISRVLIEVGVEHIWIVPVEYSSFPIKKITCNWSIMWQLIEHG